MLRITYGFQGQNLEGKVGSWSESWYHAGSLPEGIQNAVLDGSVTERSNLLAPELKIVFVRETEVDENPLGQGGALKSLSYFYGKEGAAAGTVTRDLLNVSMSCQIDGSAVKNVKRFTLPGIPDEFTVKGSGIYPKSFTDAFKAWMRYLTDGGFLFRCEDLAELQIGVASITALGVVTTLSDHNYNPGNFVLMNRVRNTLGKPVSGVYYVSAVADARNFTLLGYNKGACGQVGKVRRRKYLYVPLKRDSQIIKGVTTRPIGRPSNQFRGRRRKAR